MRIVKIACFLILGGLSPGAITLEEVETKGVASFQHAGILSEVVCHSDGVHVLSSARDQCVRLWELKSGKLIRRFTSPECGDMWGIRFLEGGEEFLAASSSNKIFRFEVKTGKVLQTYKHSGDAYRIALHPDGKHFIGTDGSNSAILWEIESGKKVRSFKGHSDDVYTALVVEDGKRLITGSDDKTLKQWDVETGKCLKTLKEKPDYGDVFTLISSPDKKQFAMVSGDNHVRVFDSKTLEVVWKMKMKQEGQVVAWSPDGKVIASTSDDEHLYLLNAKDGELIRKIKVPDSKHTPITFSNDGKILISGGDNILHLHEVATGKRIEPEMGFSEVYDSYDEMVVGPKGERIYYSYGRNLEMRDRVNPENDQSLREARGISSMALSDDGRLLAVGCEQGAISVRDAVTLKVICKIKTGGDVRALDFHPDDTKLVSAGAKGQVTLWLCSLPTGRKIRDFNGHKANESVTGASFSAEGEQLITISTDKTVRIWSVVDGDEQAFYKVGNTSPSSFAMLDDGRSLLVSTDARKVLGRILEKIQKREIVDEDEVRKLLGQLGDDSFQVRQNAMEELAAFGREVVPFLQEVKTNDPEVRARLVGVKSVMRGRLAEKGLDVIATLEDDLGALAADPLGQFWVGSLGTEGAAKIVVGLIDHKEKGIKVIQTIDTLHGCQSLVFSPDGSHVGSVNADGTYSLFKVNRD